MPPLNFVPKTGAPVNLTLVQALLTRMVAVKIIRWHVLSPKNVISGEEISIVITVLGN